MAGEMQAAQAAQGFIEGVVSNYSARANIAIANRMSAANAKAGNLVRQASNAAAASEGALARWVQSVNNNRALASGGQALESNLRNYYRHKDSALAGNFSEQIRQAEQEGAMSAAAAFSGVGGSVVDMVNGSVALRDSMVREAAGRAQDMVDGDTTLRAGNIMSQMVGGLDSSVILDTLDYNIDVAQEQKSMGSLRAGLLGMYKKSGMDLTKAFSTGDGGSGTTYRTEYNGLGSRQRSSSQYDLADQMYDQKASFGYSYTPSSSTNPYSLEGGSLSPSSESDSLYSLRSR